MIGLGRHFGTATRVLAAGLVAGSLVAASAEAAPESRLVDAHWTAEGTGRAPDHEGWDSFVMRHVKPGADGVNRIDYGAVPVAVHQALKDHITRLEQVTVTALPRDAQFAYWVNLYNAVTVDLVLDAWPVDSIRKVKGGLFNLGPWDEKVVTVEGRDLSLNDIEHGILRPIWKDARIHYAVNCASVGCPNLARRAWTAARVEEMLEDAARAYVNHPRGAAVRDGRLFVSSIYDWYMEDFGGTDAGVIAHLKAYADADLAAALEGITDIADDRYDWSINGVRE